MKIISVITWFVIFITVPLFISCNVDNIEIRQAIKAQVELYPESTLQDIYKSFFQDEFGPGHLIEDTSMARKYLEYELADMTSRGNYNAELCGVGLNFYRVPLDLVKDGKISFEDFLTAFLESASSFRIPETSDWKGSWKMIVTEIESMDIEIKNFDADKKALSEMLDEGETVVHHSESYSHAYNPHYRIIGKAQWEKLAKK
jgi:hypothetical protein